MNELLKSRLARRVALPAAVLAITLALTSCDDKADPAQSRPTPSVASATPAPSPSPTTESSPTPTRESRRLAVAEDRTRLNVLSLGMDILEIAQTTESHVTNPSHYVLSNKKYLQDSGSESVPAIQARFEDHTVSVTEILSVDSDTDSESLKSVGMTLEFTVKDGKAVKAVEGKLADNQDITLKDLDKVLHQKGTVMNEAHIYEGAASETLYPYPGSDTHLFIQDEEDSEPMVETAPGLVAFSKRAVKALFRAERDLIALPDLPPPSHGGPATGPLPLPEAVHSTPPPPVAV